MYIYKIYFWSENLRGRRKVYYMHSLTPLRTDLQVQTITLENLAVALEILDNSTLLMLLIIGT